MPVSQFSWPSKGFATSQPGQAPIFQVFGTKRKAGETQEVSTTDMQSQEAKRQCVWGNPVPAAPLHMDNNNYISVPSQQESQPLNQNAVSPEYVQWQMQQSAQPEMPSSVAMEASNDTEMCDVATSSPPASSNQSERPPTPYHDMDSDYVPDFQQYGVSNAPDCCGRPNSDHCRQYCGSGRAVSGNSHVRCFCKPSWDAQMDLKPYVSDIY